MNKKNSAFFLTPLFLITPAAISYAQSSAAATQQQEPSLMVIKQRAGLSELDTPAAVSVIDADDMRHSIAKVNLSESPGSMPGLQIQNRQNYAQDLQLSVRGFGSRSMYGVRMYVDGISATMPEGQGQTLNIDINSIGKVEVLRGPNSALYGNA